MNNSSQTPARSHGASDDESTDQSSESVSDSTSSTDDNSDNDNATMPDLWTPQETADYLQVSLITLARWRTAKTGPPFIKLGPGANAPVRYVAVKKYITSL